MNIHLIANIIGLIGVVTVLSAYILLQLQRLDPYGFLYSFLNFSSSAMVLFSLYFEWNLPSAIIETIWALISFYGLYRALSKKKCHRH